MSSASRYKALALVGPRQSGKTTLAKNTFPKYQYLSLENPDHRARAEEDPRLFLSSIKESVILDEVQNVPDLFSYLQEILDDRSDTRQFILAGSNSFKLNEKIAQSLAGRIRIFHILLFVYEEIPKKNRIDDLDEFLTTGLYPRIYDEKLPASEWFSSYYQTYLQKDVKSLLNVSDITQFDRFVRLCAGRAGQLGDFAAIASEVGVSQPTAVRWTTVLESSFICFRLAPFFRNFNKKIIKTPKIYFFDTGLLCQLLRITSADQLVTHPMRGAIFENYVISEFIKISYILGHEPPVYFWRDQHGHEIDLTIDQANDPISIEIKSGSTFRAEWLKDLIWFSKLQKNPDLHLIYGGDEEFQSREVNVVPWKKVFSLARNLIG